MNERKHLRILQYNLGKSRTVTDSVLNDPTSQNTTILVLQEQYWSRHTKSSLIHHSWTLIEPSLKTGTWPRAAIYINKALLPPSAFAQVLLPFSDIVAVAITTTDKPILIINLYNPQRNGQLITPLKRHLQQHLHMQEYSKVLILGDFNLHHPLWNPPF